MKYSKWFLPHVAAVVGFIIVALVYFYPVMQGKKLYQGDIAQYIGMAKEQNDFRKQYDQEPYWTNSAFGGMPTYQLGAKYPHNYVKSLDGLLRFLPSPADYLFLYFVGFYILLAVLGVKPLQAFIGALAFGFSTYLIVILGAGHNAKAHAIAYMPMVLAGVLLVFQKRYIIGGILTAVATALEISANHFQMTYYLLLLLLIVGVFYTISYIKQSDFKGLFKAAGIFIVAVLLAVGANATNIMATSEYAKFSTRHNSELTYEPDGSPKTSNNAMSYDYITEYSYGVAESFNLISPRLFGGSNAEKLSTNSEMYSFLTTQGVPQNQAAEIVQQMPLYWGDQPIVAAPAYIGIVVFFLALVGLFLEKRKIKYIFLTGALFSLLLSWGKNFGFLTDFFINYVPMYNKFRAVSSIQVILEMCLPVLAVLGIYNFYKPNNPNRFKALVQSGTITGVILLILFFAKSSFAFAGGSDAYYAQMYGQPFINALKADRQSVFTSDLIRSFLFAAATFVLLWLTIKNILSEKNSLIVLGLVLVMDLFLIDKNYVNATDFMPAYQVDKPYEASEIDNDILKDSTHFRVLNLDEGINGAKTSYFHKSLGGYHAAKPRRLQQLFDYHINKNNLKVLNMLNTKYILQTDPNNGETRAMLNVGANGNAWFVQQVNVVNTPDAEIKALDTLQNKKQAVVQQSFVKNIPQRTFPADTTATITLQTYKPNYLKYQSNNTHNGFAVFSEIYYPQGWEATIDGKSTPIINANYVLRALNIPAGKHTIEFNFKPQVVATGSKIALISSILLLLSIVGGIFYMFTKQPKKTNE